MTNFQTAAPSTKNYKFTENAFLPEYVTIPISQTKDLQVNNLVNIGDKVEEGQVIAINSMNNGDKIQIHSPIPGEVVDLISTICPSGNIEKAFKIKLGGKFTYTGKKLEVQKWKAYSPNGIVSRLLENGVINTFLASEFAPLGTEIRKQAGNRHKKLIVRLFDEDRLRIFDSLFNKFYFEEIFTGAQITAKALDADKIVFAIDQNFEHKEDLEKLPSDYEIKTVTINSTKYPAGFKHEIVNAYSKEYKRTDDNLITVGDLFTDANTMYQTYKAIVYGIPSIEKPVHFSGNALYSAGFINVKLGTSLRTLVEQIGGFKKKPTLIVINGLICGTNLTSLDVPITKYVKSIEFISDRQNTDYFVYSCVNCGNCYYACPVNISPYIIYNYLTNNQKISEAHKKSALLCSACNLCNTVCQARLPLSQTILVLKNRLLEEDDGRK